MAVHETEESPELSSAFEDFSRDLLVLVKTSSVYPVGHPAPIRVADRLAKWSPPDGSTEFSVGITPTKLLYDNHILGSQGSRAESLAALLHKKKIMRLRWGERVQSTDVASFASVISLSKLSGAELLNQLENQDVYTIQVDPLDVSKIHTALFSENWDAQSPGEVAGGNLDGWLWLQDGATQVPQLAEALRSRDFWRLARDNPSFPVGILLQHVDKLEQAMNLLDPEERGYAREGIGHAGKALPVADLASILMSELRTSGEGAEESTLSTLFGELSTEDLIDLMAAIVALKGHPSARATTIFKALAPRCNADEMLSLIDARLDNEAGQAYSTDVWRTVKTFLVDLEEGAFFGDDYVLDVEQMSLDCPEEAAHSEPSEFSVKSDPHLDWAYLAVAVQDQTATSHEHLRKRVEARLTLLPPSELLRFVTGIDDSLAEFFPSQQELTKDVFGRLIGELRLLDNHDRKMALAFAKRNEGAVVGLVLSRLVAERRITGRRFLVDILSAMSAETTPELVTRSCEAPWYYTRNVATVLGRRRERDSASILEALLQHPHEKVRRESLKGLGKMGGTGRNVLQHFADTALNRAEERALAKRILGRDKEAS